MIHEPHTTPEEDPQAWEQYLKQRAVDLSIRHSHDTEAQRAKWAAPYSATGQYAQQLEAALRMSTIVTTQQGGAILFGDPGRGKSHLSGIATHGLRKRIPTIWVRVSRLLSELRMAELGEHVISLEQLMLRTANAPGLILDDLAAGRTTAFREEKLVELLELRCEGGEARVTLATTNLAPTALQESLTVRGYSRLRELCPDLIKISGQDLRQPPSVLK